MYKIVETPITKESDSFQCPVSGDGKAVLKVPGKKFHVIVRETSIKGFTLEMKTADAKRCREAKKAELKFDDRRINVQPGSSTQLTKDKAMMHWALISEHEPKDKFRLRIPFFNRNRRNSNPDITMSVAAYAGVVLFLFCVLAMPGLGDHLGTAPLIEEAVELVLGGLDQRLTNFRP